MTEPEVLCPCGRHAPRYMVAVGLDLHACTCGAHVERWHCCGAVVVHPTPTAAYREREICPACGASRRPPQAQYRPLTGGVSLAELNARGRAAAAARLEEEED
jgi:hypothetical protein